MFFCRKSTSKQELSLDNLDLADLHVSLSNTREGSETLELA